MAAFDRIAPRYDQLWTNSPVGRLQRDAVWRHVDSLFRRGDAVLDLGCGTGEDALHLMQSGVRVTAIDSSPEMVRLASERGVDARTLAIEEIDRLAGTGPARPSMYERNSQIPAGPGSVVPASYLEDSCFDGAIGNFGALNCVQNLEQAGAALARRVRPRGRLVLCTMGCFCLWETAHYALRLQFGKAFRRLRRDGVPSRLGVRVFYPSVRRLVAAFRPGFELVDWAGVGFCVPPSYVSGLSGKTLAKLGAVDRRVAHWPVLRGLSDHRLLIFVRK